jgi:hypothetical protein
MRYALYKKSSSKIIFILGIFYVFIPLVTFASAQITEIMYDVPGTDTGREWIEIQNTGSTTLDLSTWKIYEANTNHKITTVANSNVPAGGFAVVADSSDKFKIDNPGYTGLVFDSTFSLSNEGESITLRNQDGGDVDTVSYIPTWGAAGDGNSLQKTGGNNWIASLPTIGSITTASQSSIPINNNSNTASTTDYSSTSNETQSGQTVFQDLSQSTHSSQEVANVSPDEILFEVTSGRSRFGFVGSPLSFEAKIKTSKNVPQGTVLESVWSMGDGYSVSGRSIDHVYSYAGDYVVILNSKYGDAEAVSRINVHISNPHLSITEVNGNHITIYNPDSFEMNAGNYSLSNESGRFVIAPDTIIKSHASLKIFYPNTKLSYGTSINLMDPVGRVVSTGAYEEPLITLPADVDISVLKTLFQKYLSIKDGVITELKK